MTHESEYLPISLQKSQIILAKIGDAVAVEVGGYFVPIR